MSRDAQSYVNNDVSVARKAVPVVFSSAQGGNISLGTDSSVGLTFMPNSVQNADGTVHRGDVSNVYNSELSISVF